MDQVHGAFQSYMQYIPYYSHICFSINQMFKITFLNRFHTNSHLVFLWILKPIFHRQLPIAPSSLWTSLLLALILWWLLVCLLTIQDAIWEVLRISLHLNLSPFLQAPTQAVAWLPSYMKNTPSFISFIRSPWVRGISGNYIWYNSDLELYSYKQP